MNNITEIHEIKYHPGNYYHWHCDDCVGHQIQYEPPSFLSARPGVEEYVRKLAFSLQLSNEEDYTGGEIQIIQDTQSMMETVPKKRGTLVIFDSRTRHRIKPVKSGIRYVLVGWVIGPRWK